MLKYFDILKKKKMKYKVSQCSCFYNQLRSDLFETFLKNVSLQWNQTRKDAKYGVLLTANLLFDEHCVYLYVHNR